MRAGISLLISATLFAGAALAEPGSAPATPPAAAVQPGPPAATPANSPPASAPPAGTKTVEGLTVMGKTFPTKECGSRDKECITTVVAELKRLYPEQLKKFCFQREMRAMRNGVEFGDADPSQPAAVGATFSPAAPLAIACTRDKK